MNMTTSDKIKVTKAVNKYLKSEYGTYKIYRPHFIGKQMLVFDNLPTFAYASDAISQAFTRYGMNENFKIVPSSAFTAIIEKLD